MLKGLTQSTQGASSPDKEDESMSKRVAHLALAYGWWIAKSSLPISVLKVSHLNKTLKKT
ncbi:hypothetical protein CROQUDRAFT_184032 [Cronartium quercuum f. sp. fusiforme G11]|uniref:Uncharacterized protein n=1 Tax=Cronartium quercuum f. sp. fusiforme G11 TaxID=708437 RepID=A0A9P6NCJ8_9BASI|nr:hypothetical protein CROQUDRAFT_184032 [Cronartium quercuum f. sp. fusiforme G11]